MSARLLAMSSRLFASPLCKGERIEERGSTLLLGSETLTLLFPVEKREANIALTK